MNQILDTIMRMWFIICTLNIISKDTTSKQAEIIYRDLDILKDFEEAWKKDNTPFNPIVFLP